MFFLCSERINVGAGNDMRFFFVFNLFLVGLSGFLSTESQFRPTVHAASTHGTPSLMSLPKDGKVSCEVSLRGHPSGV